MRWLAAVAVPVLLMGSAAAAEDAVGQLFFEAPASFWGKSMQASLQGTAYIAAYDVGNQSQSSLELTAQAGTFHRIVYDQVYVTGGPGDYGGIPQTERLQNRTLGQVRWFRILEPLENFTLILRLKTDAEVGIGNGTIRTPIETGLLMSRGVRGDRLEPHRNDDPWQANFVDVPLEGPPHHHIVTTFASLQYQGPVEILLSHAIVEFVNETGRHRLVLDSSISFEGGVGAAGTSAPVARQHAEMLRAETTAHISGAIHAPFVRVLHPTPSISEVQSLEIPLATGRLETPDGDVVEYENHDHLGIAGSFALDLREPRKAAEGFEQVESRLHGQIFAVAANRAAPQIFGRADAIAVATGLALVTALGLWLRRSAVFLGRDALAQIVGRVLGGPFGLGGFTRLQRSQLLINPLRARLLDMIKETPGTCFSHLQLMVAIRPWRNQRLRGNGVTNSKTNRRVHANEAEPNLCADKPANGLLQHHLDVLEKHKLVQSFRAGRFRRYFCGEIVRPVAENLSVAAAPIVKCIISEVLIRPGLDQRSLLSAVRYHFKLGRTGLGYRVRGLVARGLLRETRVGRRVHYSEGPELAAVRQFWGIRQSKFDR